MEVQEEAKGSKHSFKGKRTKRQRTMSPFPLNMATTSSCSSGEAMIGSGGVFGDSSPYSGGFDRVTPSPSNNSGELAQSSVEEEDMANCLILLAQGQTQKSSPPPASAAVVAVTSSKSTADQDVYQCKTCDRCFPSFQALGGHRASHKKPKPILEDHKNNALLLGHQETSVRLIKAEDTNTTLSLQIPSSGDNSRSPNNNKSRVHECSICGAEFTSGQALGGHMRRHRPLPVVARTSSNDEGSQEAVKKPRTLLALDLNLPAPDHEPEEDNLLESKYPFASTEQVIVFSASHPLVDCHY